MKASASALALLVIVIAFTTPVPVGAQQQETVIRILGIYNGPQNDDEMAEMLSAIETAWSASGLGAQVSIDVANGGNAIYVASFNASGSMESQLLSALSAVKDVTASSLSIRDQFAADVVIAFGTPDANSCGAAPSFFLLGNWNPVGGIDVSGSELALLQ